MYCGCFFLCEFFMIKVDVFWVMVLVSVVFKGLVNEYFGDLEVVCDVYLCWFFFEWKKVDRIYMFFLVFLFWYIVLIGKVFGVVLFGKLEEVDVKGDEVELRIFCVFDKFGR